MLQALTVRWTALDSGSHEGVLRDLGPWGLEAAGLVDLHTENHPSHLTRKHNVATRGQKEGKAHRTGLGAEGVSGVVVSPAWLWPE